MNKKIILYKVRPYFDFLVALLLLILLIISFIFWVYVGAFLLILFYIFNFYYLFEILFTDFNYQNKKFWSFILIIFPGGGSYLYFSFAKISIKKANLDNNLPIIKNDLQNADIFLLASEFESFEIDSNLFLIDEKEQEINNFIQEIKNARKEICFFLSSLDNGLIWKIIKEELNLKVKLIKDFSIIFIVDFFALDKNNKKIIKEIKEIENFKILYFNNWNIFLTPAHKNKKGNFNFIIIDQKTTYFNGIIFNDQKFLFSKNGFVFTNGFKFKDNLTIFFNHFFNYLIAFSDQKLSEKREQEISNLKKLDHKKNLTENIQIFANGFLDKKDLYYQKFINSINKAKTSIKIIISNILLLDDFKNCLLDALSRNISIKIIISNPKIKDLKTKLSYFYEQELISLGAEVFKFNYTKIVTNFLIIDNNNIIFSSSDFSYNQIFNNLNLNLIINSKEFANKANLIFKDLLKNSYKEKTNYLKWSIFKQSFYKLVNFISPIL